MPPLWLFILVALAGVHIVCDVYGLPIGTQLRWLFKPAVWLIFALTFGFVNLGKCAACKEREKLINELFGNNHPTK